jgi:hypothetical protein
MRIESFVFEADAGARPQTIEETFLEEVEGADLYIGVFWRGYGRYTGLSHWAFLLVKAADTAHGGLRTFNGLAGSRSPVPSPKTAFTCRT